jgi:hypothetical protein
LLRNELCRERPKTSDPFGRDVRDVLSGHAKLRLLQEVKFTKRVDARSDQGRRGLDRVVVRASERDQFRCERANRRTSLRKSRGEAKVRGE